MDQPGLVRRWGTIALLALAGCPGDDTTSDTLPTTDPTLEPTTGGGDSTTSGAESTGEDPGNTSSVDPSTSSGAADSSTSEPPPPAMCGNGVQEGDEKCDGEDLAGGDCLMQGFQGGELGCDADCDNYNTENCFFFICGNDTIQGDEVCDGENTGVETCQTQGFESGSLGCTVNCLDFDTSTCGICGDGTLNGDEPCEGADLGGTDCEMEGFEGGNLACAADCTLDTSDCSMCGDGVVTGFEPCDGGDLGGETCASLGLEGGTLGCTPGCVYDFSMCDIAGIPFGSDIGYDGFALTPGVLPCDDISGTGTPTGLTDDSNVSVAIGFTFPVYGVNQTMANIQSNGALRFGDALYLGLTNSCLPTATAPSTNSLYLFWDDLNPSLGAGEIYYQTLGPAGSQRFVVQWDTANYAGDAADLMRMQAVLHEGSGQIDVCYVDTINAANIGNSGAEATAGIQENSMNALQYSCNTADLVNGLMLLYIPN
jgi:hypothetical protein